MAISTNAQLKLFSQKTCEDSSNAISSLGFADGRSPSSLPDGKDQFGLEAALASHGVLPEKGRESQTTVTSGLTSSALSPSQDLSDALGSRLRDRLGCDGSPEYRLTWKEWVTPSGLRIFALRASKPRTSGSDSIGWPTPAATDYKAVSKKGQRRGQLTEAVETEASWVPCQCEEFFCNLHMMHASDCDCPPIEEWDVDPYGRIPRGWRLNPSFQRWLMGFSQEWERCEPTATPSSRNSPPSS